MPGYFISPSNEIIKVAHLHINTVFEKPELFGWTEENLRSVFRKHSEKIGLEGKARREILSEIIEKGFIRIRYRERAMSFTFQLSNYNDQSKAALKMFTIKLLNGDLGWRPEKNTGFRIIDLNGNVLTGNFYTLSDLVNGILENQRPLPIVLPMQPKE